MAREFGLAFIAACFANAAIAQSPSPVAAPLVDSGVSVGPMVAPNSSKLALLGAHLGHVDVEVADRV